MRATEHPGVAGLPGLGSMLLKPGIGGRWILPKVTTPRIGPISLGKQDLDNASATARYDYFRVYRP